MTTGRYVNTGKDSRIIDNWSQSENAHRLLGSLWVGTTTYKEASDFLVEDPAISSLQRVENYVVEGICVKNGFTIIGVTHITMTSKIQMIALGPDECLGTILG